MTFKALQPDLVIRSSVGITEDGNVASVVFDNLLIDLDAADAGLVAQTVYSFHLLSEDKDVRPSLEVDLRYFVSKTPWSVAKLVFMGAEALRSLDFEYGSSLDTGQTVRITCPGRIEAAGTSFQFTIALLGHRVSADQRVKIQIDSLDIVAVK